MECGAHFVREAESCPSCGLFARNAREVVTGRRLPATGGIPTLAVVLAFFVPSPFEGLVVSAGFTPLLALLAWLAWRKRQRDPGSFALRIRDVRRRLAEVERDLGHTDERVEAAREDLSTETRARATAMLERELAQDRRLRSAQRKLVGQLEQRLEQLEIERFRSELRYYESCRDARLDAPEIAEELAARIDAIEARLPEATSEGWANALEEAHLLERQISRGVQRLRAALNLDPLGYADLAVDETAESSELDVGELDDQVEHHLERIERGFAALDELCSELARDADASGVRIRVDDEVMAALEEASLDESGTRSTVISDVLEDEVEIEAEPSRASVPSGH